MCWNTTAYGQGRQVAAQEWPYKQAQRNQYLAYQEYDRAFAWGTAAHSPH